MLPAASERPPPTSVSRHFMGAAKFAPVVDVSRGSTEYDVEKEALTQRLKDGVTTGTEEIAMPVVEYS